MHRRSRATPQKKKINDSSGTNERTVQTLKQLGTHIFQEGKETANPCYIHVPCKAVNVRRGRGTRNAFLKQANDTSREKLERRGEGGYKKERQNEI